MTKCISHNSFPNLYTNTYSTYLVGKPNIQIFMKPHANPMNPCDYHQQ